MTSESQRELLSPSPRPQALGPPSAFRLSTFFLRPTAYSLKPGLSLVELLIAIGILGVTMTLIGAAFPAGVMMSIAVSDETTSQAVFQKAVAEIKGKLSCSSGDVVPDSGNPLKVVDYDALGTPAQVLKSRRLTDTSSFSWAALIRRVDDSATAGPMGNLCQVVVVVSRRPSGSPNFKPEPPGADTKIPELRSVNCTGSDPDARTLDIAGTMVPNGGYIIDETTGTAYIIVSRDNNKVVTLGKPPSNADIGAGRDFWLVPGPYDGSKYSPKSPAIRVFQAMLYLP